MKKLTIILDCLAAVIMLAMASYKYCCVDHRCNDVRDCKPEDKVEKGQ